MARPSRVILLVALSLTVGCSAIGGDVEETQDGMGVPQQWAGEVYPGTREQLVSELHVTETGCLHVVLDDTSRFAIWPAGSELAEGANAIRLPDGAVLADGDRFEAIGAATPANRLTADADGYWAFAIGFCDPEAEVVIVLDEVRLVD